MRANRILRVLGLWPTVGLLLPLLACGGGTATFLTPPPVTGGEFVLGTSNGLAATFTINTTNGALGAAVTAAGPASSSAILASPSGKFVYVSNSGSAMVDVFSLNASTGGLTPITGSPFSIGASAFGLATDPAGKFLFTMDGVNSQVFAFTLNSSTGALTSVAGSPFPAANGPTNAAVDPSGHFLFVSNNQNALGGISAYTINSSTGALTAVSGSPFTTLLLGGPSGLAVHPNDKFLYVAESNVNAIAELSINATGSLATAPGSPFAAGGTPFSIVIHPTGKFLYAANNASATISAYTIDSTSGNLTAVAGSPFAAGTASGTLAVDASGKFLYQANSHLSGASTITGFNINSSTGALTQFSGTPFAAGNGPVTLTTVKIQ